VARRRRALEVLLGGGCGAASRGGHRSDRPRRASCGAVGAGCSTCTL